MKLRDAAILSFLAGVECKKPEENSQIEIAECYVEKEVHEAKSGLGEVRISDDSLLRVSDKIEIDVLKGRFKNEALRQYKIVKKAGGYCELPEKFDANDKRLGDELKNISEERDAFLIEAFGTKGDFNWSVDLRRAECEVVDGIEIRDELEISVKETGKLKANVGRVVEAWNRYCAEMQDGYFEKKYATEPMAAGMLLTLRGWEINNSVFNTSELRKEWRRVCTPDEDPEKTIEGEELEEFAASQVLARQVLSNSVWTCPTDEEVNKGFEFDECGRLKKCVPTGEVDGIGERGRFIHDSSLYINPNFLDY